ncbi:hypothetical protein ACU8V3_15275 [Cobetia marina]
MDPFLLMHSTPLHQSVTPIMRLPRSFSVQATRKEMISDDVVIPRNGVSMALGVLPSSGIIRAAIDDDFSLWICALRQPGDIKCPRCLANTPTRKCPCVQPLLRVAESPARSLVQACLPRSIRQLLLRQRHHPAIGDLHGSVLGHGHVGI